MSKNVTFKTRRKSGSHKKAALIIIIAAVIAGVITVSCYSILKKNDFNLKSALGGDVEETTDASGESGQVKAEKSTRRYLFWCKDSQTDKLEFLWVAKFSMPEGKYTVYSPSIDEVIEYKDNYSTLGNIFASYGEQGLVDAVNLMCGITVDNYIGSDTEHFKQMINYLGSVTVKLDEAINYRGDFNLILMQGDNVLKGDTLYKFLVYTNYAPTDSSAIRCDIFESILRNTINPGNKDKIEKLFSRIANLLITDLTIVDFSASSDYLDNLFETGVNSVITAEKAAKIK